MSVIFRRSVYAEHITAFKKKKNWTIIGATSGNVHHVGIDMSVTVSLRPEDGPGSARSFLWSRSQTTAKPSAIRKA